MAVTCSINGTRLEWAQPDGTTIFTFSQFASVGSGFTEEVNCDQAGRVRASGVLEAVDPGSDFAICNSTMVLTPSPDCISLNVTCKSSGGPDKSTRIKVAGEFS